MKVLYVASNPQGAASLMVEREVTELLRGFVTARGERIEFIPCPDLPIEELPLEISRHRPDILHISAHGDEQKLGLANASGTSVPLTGEMLRAYLNFERPPRLVYLNACDSKPIAKDLIKSIPMAIGTTAPISNRTARASAVLFYDRLISGATVQNAFEASRATIEAMNSSATTVLCRRRDVKPDSETLYQAPRIVAKFKDDNYDADDDDDFEVVAGIFGCPSHTAHVVLFTDDRSFIDQDDAEKEEDAEDEYFLASQLCRVIRDTPVRNVIWSDYSDFVFGDYRLFAMGVTASGEVFSLSATVCEAIETYFRVAGPENATPPNAAEAIAKLRSNDGSGLPTKRAPKLLRNKKQLDRTKRNSNAASPRTRKKHGPLDNA